MAKQKEEVEGCLAMSPQFISPEAKEFCSFPFPL